jgi:hypothetical protein
MPSMSLALEVRRVWVWLVRPVLIVLVVYGMLLLMAAAAIMSGQHP